MAGKLTTPDRLQRLLLGACLMTLSILGLLESPEWKKWTALALQSELILTGIAGWCPFYWACNVTSESSHH